VGVAIGIDVGSVAVKLMALADGRPVFWAQEPTRPEIPGQCAALLERARRECASDGGWVVCATGYGRHLVPGAACRISEIMANAAGGSWLRRNWESLGATFGSAPVPERLDGTFRTIIDVGGQDTKVLVFDSDGMIRDFAMNDRCAAGTGRFLEVMARVLDADLARLDELAARAPEPAVISSACTVFAESEVVSLLAEGASKEAVAAGVFDSVAAQVRALAERCGWRPPVLFDGGASRSVSLRKALGRRLGCEPAVAPCGQFATALGAALLAGVADGARSV